MTANEAARYINTAEAAKMIRAALKKSYPGVKFSVRISRYSGGSSIDVDWIDGPTQAMVDALIGEYRGGGFDGTIDMAYYTYHWLLPDGSVMAAKSSGTEGSGGMVPAFSTARPDGAELVHFNNGHLFTKRKLSPQFMRQAFARLQRKYGEDFLEGCEVRVSDYDGAAHLVGFKDSAAEQFAYREIKRLMIARAA